MTKISVLPENTNPAVGDSLPSYDSVNGNTKRFTITRIIDLVKTALGYSSAPDTSWHYVGSGGSEPAFANSWVNYDSTETTFYKAQFSKDAFGWVTVRGLIKDGTISSSLPAFTLPTGYRPLKRLRFAIVSTNAFGAASVQESGIIAIEVGTSGFVFLDGIRFKAGE